MKKRGVFVLVLSLLIITMLGIGMCSAAVLPVIPAKTAPALTIDPSILKEIISAPSDLTATVSGLDISLSWEDTSSNETAFEIERKSARGFSKIATVGAGITSYDDNDLAAGTRYVYRVRAVNDSASSAYSNEAAATAVSPLIVKPGLPVPDIKIPLLPAAPVGLQAVSESAPEIKLSWVDKSGNEAGFKLERKHDSLDFTEITVIPGDATAYNDTGLLEGTTYTYRLCAFNAAGSSAYSNEASAQTAITVVAQPLQKIIKYRIGQYSYTLNGASYAMDVAPVIIRDRTFLPIRYVAEPLGAAIYWDGALQKATVILNGTTVEMVVNSHIAWVNGVETPISADPQVTPMLESGRVLVPMAFVASSLGCGVTWDGSIQEVTLTYPK